MADGMLAARSVLFVPASRPEMIAKLATIAPDVAVVDLEDAVPAADKHTARETAVRALGVLEPGRTVVLIRVNPIGSPWFDDDLAAVSAAAGCAGVVLPKFENPARVDMLRSVLGSSVLVAGLETARGVADCRVLLASGVDGCYFGAEDYIADLGGRRTAEGLEVLYARSQVCLAAQLAGIAAIDQAVVSIRDDERFRQDAERGRAIGYTAKICVHPRQVDLAHEVFTPSEGEVDHARAVLRAAKTGVGTVDGEMVDDVHVRMARRLLSRAPGATGER